MKKGTSPMKHLPLKVAAALFILFFSTFSFLSYRTTRIYAEVWEQLGTTNEKLRENVEMSFFYNYLNYYGTSKLKNILANDRPAIAKDLAAYVKQYINSDIYKKKYEEFRQSMKPQDLQPEPKTKEDIRNQMISELEKGIKNLEETLKKNPSMEKDIRPTIEMFRKNIADYKDPNNKMIDMMYQGHVAGEEQKKTRYKNDMENWGTDFPADYRQLVKKRLQKFVDIAATVDFSAELKEANGKKVFVKPEYESKSSDWKQIFRAGKPVIDPTVAFARQWINEIK